MTRETQPRRETWRSRTATLIGQIKQGQSGLTRRELRLFYPWGTRRGDPYRAWCWETRALVGPGRGSRAVFRPARAWALEESEP